MTEQVSAAFIGIGTELTEGTIQDSHGRRVASALKGLGVRVDAIILLPDNLNVVAELNRCFNQYSIVIVSGGLGPTSDDITREVIAMAAGVPLKFHDELWIGLEKRLSHISIDSNRRQAFIPEGFLPLENKAGSAPGFHGFAGESQVFVLPGPPSEFSPMFEELVIPLLVGRFGLTVPEMLEMTVFLVPESKLEDECRKCSVPEIYWGTRVQPFRISLYIRGGTNLDRNLFADKLRSRLSGFLLKDGSVEAHELLVSRLTAEGKVVALAESCTGGLTGKMITDIPGSSKVFWGSLVTYADDAKTVLLGVKGSTLQKEGSVSRSAVIEMTEGVLEKSGADIGVAISGIAGPGGGTKEKPAGTVWIAVGKKGSSTVAFRFSFSPYSRDSVRRRAAVAAMLLTERLLVGDGRLDTPEMWQYI